MENRKKIYYTIGGAAVLILGYLNYFSDEGQNKVKEKIIETVGVKYLSDDYIIDAGKQLDYVDKEESSFETAKAKIKDMLISGDNAFLDKARNLALNSNILGISANGWKFKADKVDYDKIKDEITSTTGVSVENKDLKMGLSGKEFKTDTKMSYIDMKKDVTLENDKIRLVGDFGKYVDAEKVAVLRDNIKLYGKESIERDGNKLTGEFKKLTYDLNRKVIEGFDPYVVNYGETTLTADDLYYKNEDESFIITKNILIKSSGYNIKVSKIEKKPVSDNIEFYGQIDAVGEKYKILGDNGVYNTVSEDLTVTGNISMKSVDGEEGFADKVVYNSGTGAMNAYGTTKDVIYKTKDGILESKQVNYNEKTKELTIDIPFKFKNKDNNGTAEKMYYNELKKEGYGDNVTIYSGERVIKTSKVLYDGIKNTLFFPNEYTMISKDKTESFSSKVGYYNLTTKDFTTDSDFVYITKGNKVTGTGIIYNTETGVGEIKANVVVRNDEKKMDIKGDRAEVKNGDFLNLIGNISMNNDEYYTEAQKAIYTFKDERISVPEATIIKSFDEKTVIEITNPIIDTKKQILYGDKFKAVSEENRKAQSNKVEYHYSKEYINLLGAGVVEDNGNIVKGDNLKYFSKTQKVEAKGAYVANNIDWTINGVDISIDNTTGDVVGGKVSALSTKKESFQSDRVKGNLNTTVDFIGNAKGRTYNSKGNPIDYAGDIVKTHYLKEEKRYKLKRVELVENSTITQEDVTLYSKYSDVDLLTEIATSYNRPHVVKKDPVKGDKTVDADKMVFHMKKDIINLYENVVVVSDDPKKGKTVGTSKDGLVLTKENIVEMMENVVIDSPDAILYADKVKYNMDTKKARATGEKVKVDYKK